MRLALTFATSFALILTASPAMAVQGDGPVRSITGERAQRIESPIMQRAWARQQAWREFTVRRGGQWTAQFDDITGTPVRFYGTGWDVDDSALSTDDGAFAIARTILAEERGLLGRDVRIADLERGVVDRTAGITTVTFQQTWNGLRVDETRLSLRFKAGRFVMGQVETLPVFDGVATSEQITSAQALSAAQAALGWERIDRVYATDLVVLPIRGESALTAKLAWRFDIASEARRSHPVVWVDALDGRLIGWEEQIRFAGGTIEGAVDDRYPENGNTAVPLRFAELDNEDGSGDADSSGVFALPGAAPDTVTLEVGSEDWRIESDGGETEFSGVLASDGGTVLVGADSTAGAGTQRRQTAELDMHVSAHIVRDRALTIHPNFQWATVQARANVNVNDGSCNAWFDPSNSTSNSNVNFLRQGDGCNNMGRVWDVMFHEYGHGFHIWSIIFGAGDFDGALSEGMGDYMSATINDDPGMARGFFVGSTDGLRDIGPNYRWPEDASAQDIHGTGRIIAGALWDVRTALSAEQGAAGVLIADALYLAVSQRASDIPSAYAEVLLADDDNGNLADGTPNQCVIDEQFGLHGLGPGTGGEAQFGVDFEPLGTSLPVGEALQLSLSAFTTNAQCSSETIEDVRLHWTIESDLDTGDFEEEGFESQGGENWSVTVPALGDGSYLRYFIELIDSNGDVARTLPQGSVSDPWYGAWVGGDALWENDFESDDGGFSSQLVQGGDQEGADDWMRDRPKGDGGDPADAASGDFAWGNDLQPQENWNGQYQNEIHNVLRSGPIEVGDGPVHLQFRRWLTVEDGLFDQAWVEVNGTTVWSNYAGPNQNDSSNHHEDAHWAFRSYEVTDLVSDGTIEVEWHLESDQGLTFGGWTVDDVRVLASEGGGVIGDDDDDDDDDDAASDDDDDVGGAGGFQGEGCTCTAAPNANSPALAVVLALLGLVGVRRRR